MTDTAANPLRSTIEGLEVSEIQRRRELVPWLVFRFLHIRVLYNWAWDPDRFDWGPNTSQYRIREKGRLTVGGYRIIAPRDSLSEAMTPALPFFREMVPNPQVWDLLEQNRDLVVEVSRFALAFFRLRDRARVQSIVRVAVRGIFWEQARLERPLCLAVVNPFLLSRYRKFGLALKVIGFRKLRAASRFERKIFGDEVPHYVVLVNSALSAKMGLEGRLSDGLTSEFLFDGLPEHATPFHLMSEAFQRRTQSVWDSVTELPEARA